MDIYVWIFIVAITIGVFPAVKGSSLPANCGVSAWHRTTLSCTTLDNLKDITPEAAAKVKSLEVSNCAADFHRFPAVDMLIRMQYLTVNCGDNANLTVDVGAFRNSRSIRRIIMKRSGIVSIPDLEFCQLDELHHLKLGRNRIEHLSQVGLGESASSSTSCKSTKTLTNVDLSSNKIQKVSNSSFLCSLANLTMLDLSHNEISEIEPEAFINNRMLKFLYLNNNELQMLPKNIFMSLSNLKVLHLSNNRLKCVDDLFSNCMLGQVLLQHNLPDHVNVTACVHLQHLQTLHLEYNDIAALPDHVFSSLTSLHSLFLCANKLTRLDQNVFVGLMQLTNLDLADNYDMEAIHENAFESTSNLAVLFLRNTMLATLPNFVFRNLTSLVVLDLSYNHLQSVSKDSFQDLESLKTLSMEHNNLSFDKRVYKKKNFKNMDVFQPLTALVHLSLAQNSLTQFYYSWFPKPVLHLNLSGNSIRQVFFRGVTRSRLTTIDMSYNRIGRIEKAYTMAHSFPLTVERIYLDHNVLTHVDAGSLKYNINLRLISLTNNRLRNLRLLPPSFSSYATIVRLSLGQNPWLCDCHLMWLKKVLEGNQNHPSFFVQNPISIMCERVYNRERDLNIPVLVADSSEDFMCIFSNGSYSLCRKRKTLANDKFEFCEHDCPEQCKCYHSDDWEVINVECTGKNLTHVPKKIHPATSLFLDHNSISIIEADDFGIQFDILEEVFLNNNVLEMIEDGAFKQLASLKRLFLQSNLLRHLAPDLFVNTTNLVKLDLSGNRLTNLSESLFQPLRLLETLLINDNQLCTFPVWNFENQLVHLEVVALYDNPWSCDCDYVASWTNWMRGNAQRLDRADQITCLLKDVNEIRMSFIAFNESVCFSPDELNSAEIVILIISLAVLVTIVLLSTFVFVYRREMQVFIYSQYSVRLFHNDLQDNEDKVFDAFVSYSGLDEDFVIHELLPGLEIEIKHPYKLCLHHRDFSIGAFITESIAEAISVSRRTILVLSENFMRSDWCRFEFRMAHSQLLQDRCKRVIVIILGDVPKILDPEMILYLRTNTYLCWKDRFFWEKLYFAMPEKRMVPVLEDKHTM